MSTLTLFSRRARAASALTVCLCVAPMALVALETAPPRAWRHGAFVVPLEDVNLAESDLQKSALNNSTSKYPDTTQDGHSWPLSTGGVLPLGGATPTTPISFYNKSWSAKGGAATGASVLIKTQSAKSPAKLKWSVSPGIHATRLRAVIMGVNVYTSQVGKKLGVVRVHRDGAADLVRTMQIGTDIRHFKWSSKNPEFIGTPPTGASNVWTGTCGSETCFVDQLVVDVPADEVKHAVTGVTVEGYRVARQVSGSSLLLYASMRVHSLTFETNFEATKGSTKVAPLSQGDCSATGGWAPDRYGGRRLTPGGTLYGPKRNIKAIGCGLTSATMVVNYHKGSALTPAQLNAELQEHGGYSPTTVGVLDGFTATVQTACATLAATHPLDDCGCCQGAACATACEGGAAPDHGDDAHEVRMCCTVAATPGLPGGGAPAVGAVVELYPSGYRRSDGTWRTSSMAKDLGTFSACGQSALPAQPAAVSGSGAPVAGLEMAATAHPFDQTGCVGLDHPAFAGVQVHPTTHLPCKRYLKLATVTALEGTPTLATNTAVRFFQLMNWAVVGTQHGLTYTHRMALDADDDETEASAVEKLYAEGQVPILRVKNNSHFLVGTGTQPRWWTDATTEGGMSVASGGGFVGTWRVADPGKVASPDLIESMHPKNNEHRNLFSGYRLLAPGTPGGSLTVTVHSPAELLLETSSGQRVGWHPQQGRLNEIVGASYGVAAVDVAPDEPGHTSQDGLPKVAHVPLSAAPLTVRVLGTGHGAFSLQAQAVSAKGAVSEAWRHSTTSPGAVATWVLSVQGGALSLAPKAGVDADKDGYSAPADCDDTDKARHPGQAEVCTGGVDDDCDGLTDAADPSCAPGAPTCSDADGDGYARCDGLCAPGALPCGDCDDTDALAHPGGKEGAKVGLTCSDGRDNDCDGAVDADVAACAGATGSPFGSADLAAAIAQSAGGADAGSSGGADAGVGDAGAGDVTTGDVATGDAAAGDAADGVATAAGDGASGDLDDDEVPDSGGTHATDVAAEDAQPANDVGASSAGARDEGCGAARTAGSSGAPAAPLALLLALVALVRRSRRSAGSATASNV